MRAIANSLSRFRMLDTLSRRQSPLHGIHPAAFVLVTVAFLVTIMSFERHAITALLPMALYPVVILTLSGTPVSALLKPLLVVEPFVVCIGLLHPLFDTQPVTVAGFAVARGWFVFFSIVIKCSFAVASALLLTAVLGMERLMAGLRILGLPRFFTLQLALTYRYIWVLLEETGKTSLACALRSPGRGGMRIRHWGIVVGGVLIRTCERAERVYQAMLLRGFSGDYHFGRAPKATWRDIVYAAGWLAFFVVVRLYNVPLLLDGLAAEALA